MPDNGNGEFEEPKPFEPFYYGPEDGIERRIEERWNENTGFQVVDEFFGARPKLENVRDEAIRCGFTDATLSQISPGSALWTLKLNYRGRGSPFSQLFQPQIEEQSTHWLIQGRYEKLPLWRHPIYSPLISCEVQVGPRIAEEISKKIPGTSYRYTRPPGDEEDILIVTPPVQPMVRASEGVDLGDLENPVELNSYYISANDRVVGISGSIPFETDIRFPYSRILQIAAQAWRQAIEAQLGNAISQIFTNLRDVAGARLALQIDGTPARVNLTEQFDVRKHLVTHTSVPNPEGRINYDYFSLLPHRTFSAIDGGEWTQDRLIVMAQAFADRILARVDTYDYSRQTIVNERIVSIRSGMNASYQGVNELWSASQIAQLIRLQMEYRRREFALEGSPSQCTQRDETMEQMIFLLEGPLSRRLFLKRPPTTRTSGRGNLEVRQEWEERFTWEVDPRINPSFEAELDEIEWRPGNYDIGDPFIDTIQTPPGEGVPV